MDIEKYVSDILGDIRNRGLEAIMEYSEKFDGYGGNIRVSREEYSSIDTIPQEHKEVILEAMERVRKVHEKQVKHEEIHEEVDFTYGLLYRPISRVGLYVPGGRPLPSSLIMMGIPARLAGVEEIVITSPTPDGHIDPYILYIARELEIEEVYKVGGVQAVGAMAYGIGMKRVDKIFGPGNKYVTEAKRQVYGTVGIDCLAGPSEVCIIADHTASKECVLADLMAQVEHGEDSRGWLLSTSKELCEYCDRKGVSIYHEHSLDRCIDISNKLAPEHLQLMTEENSELLPKIKNAGAVYIGDYTPAAACDYFVGVNHVLPTGGAAKYSSVLTVLDFMKRISFAKMSKEEFRVNRALGICMANIEGLSEHKRSMEER
ncbi:MAG: histidinol dehydrogenase [Thermoplasmata archaeon]